MLRPFFSFPTVLLVLLALAGGGQAHAGTKLLRFPDVHGERVVFSYAGDLWTTDTSGQSATRLTAHPGLELFAKFSPDGRWIAFTGQYDGDEQVYVIPSTGGVPRQLTFYPARGPLPARWGYDNQVYGWTPDGSAVLFRSVREAWGLSDPRLFTVAVQGGLPRALPMPVAGSGDLSPDGQRVAYSPLFRDFRTWKRYQGGWAQDLYIFDLQAGTAERITRHVRSDRDPMWLPDAIYFASDRDGTLNVYAYDVAAGSTRQVTHSTTWDVRWPSSDGKSQIVYELGGELHLLDVGTGRSRPLSIHVPTDDVARRPSRVSAEGQIEDLALSPKGERALFSARGDIFTAPIEKGATRNLTRSSGAHDKWPRWSPDGKTIAFISDLSGEEEVYVVDQDGQAPPRALTSGGQAMRYAPEWAPDGKRLAFSDKNGKLFVLTLADRSLVEIADEPRGQVRDYTWSPGGEHLAFSLSGAIDNRSIHVWSVADGQTRRVTGETFDEYGPAWGPEGKYLFYLSDREFVPQISSFEWNFATNRTTRIYALALRKDVKHPFPPESDEVGADDEPDKKKDSDKNDKAGKDKPAPIVIDFDGLQARVARVPVEPDNYGGLAAVKGHLLYARRPPFYYGRPGGPIALRIFSFEKREEETLAEKISNYALSSDGAKVLVQHDKSYALYDVKLKGQASKKKVSTKGLRVDRVPAEEWRQIFDEVWRRFRDFFYVENMHGYDWEALREQYRPLLAHVAHRSDLNYLLGEMVAELNVGHAYIAGGDEGWPQRPRVALLGARLELDEASGRYRFAHIYEGHNEEPRYRSPLTEVGVDVAEGDYLLAVNGEQLDGADNPYEVLRDKAGAPLTLAVSSRPDPATARQVVVDPLTQERDLIYLNWILDKQRRVAELSDGRVGYLYLPDMGASGIREFIKWFYPQVTKEGLVVDVRGNGGGNVSQMIIERLRRRLLGVRYARNSDVTGTYPVHAYHGHMVALLSENSASDGDIFPARFREAGLGPLIGKRSWGGVVGITNRGDLIDGGSVRVPEFSTNATDGAWIIEGHGVDPDIEVENDVQSVLQGRDPQLERGVAEVLARMQAEPRSLPAQPPAPVKTK